MNPLGDADAVERLAARMERNAGRLRAAGDDLAGSFDHARWQCAKADRFRHRARERQRTARQRADEFEEVALELRRHAEWIRRTSAELQGIERRIRQWMGGPAARDADGQPVWESWGVSVSLPRSGDLGWREVAKTLRRFGVRI